MRRLAFSSEAFRRRMAMTRKARLFLVTEGKSVDPWYYHKLSSQDPRLSRAGVMVYRAQSLGRELGDLLIPGGKTGVLALHDRLKELNSLTVETQDGTRSIMFCLDADHDRILNTIKRSKHITYTQLPDVEAHLINSTNELELLSMMLSCTEEDAKSAQSALGNWRRQYGEAVKEWIAACHLGHELSLEGAPAPDTFPPIKSNTPVRIDLAKLNAINDTFENKVRTKTDLSKAKREVARRIDNLYASDKYLRLIKGKWLASHLAAITQQYARDNDLDNPGSAVSVLHCCKGALRFNDPWTRYWTSRAHALLG